MRSSPSESDIGEDRWLGTRRGISIWSWRERPDTRRVYSSFDSHARCEVALSRTSPHDTMYSIHLASSLRLVVNDVRLLKRRDKGRIE